MSLGTPCVTEAVCSQAINTRIQTLERDWRVVADLGAAYLADPLTVTRLPFTPV